MGQIANFKKNANQVLHLSRGEVLMAERKLITLLFLLIINPHQVE